MHGPLLFLSVFPVHQAQWGLTGYYCRAAGRSHSNVLISSESHYTMVCLLTINFPNKLLFGDIHYLCWKTLLSSPSLPPYPTSFLSSSTSSSSPPPASTAHVVSLFTSSFPLCPSPSFPFLLPTDITILSAVPGSHGSFSGQWVFCSLICFLPCSHLFLACLQKLGMGECKGCGQLILRKQMNSARSTGARSVEHQVFK